MIPLLGISKEICTYAHKAVCSKVMVRVQTPKIPFLLQPRSCAYTSSVNWVPTSSQATFCVTNKSALLLWQPHYNQGEGKATHSSTLPGKSHGWRSLVGCSPWSFGESGMTEWLHFHFSLSCIGEGNGNPLQYSCLENPREGGAWWAAIYGVTQSRTRLKRLSSCSSVIIKGKIQTTNTQLITQ